MVPPYQASLTVRFPNRKFAGIQAVAQLLNVSILDLAVRNTGTGSGCASDAVLTTHSFTRFPIDVTDEIVIIGFGLAWDEDVNLL